MITLDANALAAALIIELRDALVRAVEEAVRQSLDQSVGERFLDVRELSALLGVTPAALKMRMRRGSSLRSLAVQIDGRRLWPRSVVLAALRVGSGRTSVDAAAAPEPREKRSARGGQS